MRFLWHLRWPALAALVSILFLLRARQPTAEGTAPPAEVASVPVDEPDPTEPPAGVLQPESLLFVPPDPLDPIDTLLVTSADPWLTLIAAPVAARLARPDRIPALLVHDADPPTALVFFLKQMRRRHVLALSPEGMTLFADALQFTKGEIFSTSADPLRAGCRIAKRFWEKPDRVVAAATYDPEGMILASTLAAHLRLPFVPFTEGDEAERLGAEWEDLGLEEVLLVHTRPRAPPSTDIPSRVPLLLLPAEEVEARLLRCLGRETVRNLLPIAVRDLPLLGDYEVDIEPCSGPTGDGAAALAVGRIPCRSMELASIILSRGALRDRQLLTSPPRALLVGNPQTEYAAMPLGETISRVSAQEFKNCGVAIDEFYHQDPREPAMFAAAQDAQFILYNGHISDLYLFDRDDGLADMPEGPWDEFYDEGVPWPQDLPYRDVPAPADVPPEAADLPPGEIGSPQAPPLERMPRMEPDPPAAELAACSVVFLQSCHSLEDYTATGLFGKGGAAFIGSVTSIHSASGSAFAKAFADGVLLRGDTVGEALREARNYFLCLANLKSRRGHKECAKVYRVALTFRLWGDPELVVFPGGTQEPRRAAISGRIASARELVIQTPDRRLPEVSTQRYVMQTFPGGAAAGLVKRRKTSPQRRILPLYFLRLPCPPGLTPASAVRLLQDQEEIPRGVGLVDALGRSLYVLYLPADDVPEQTLGLQICP